MNDTRHLDRALLTLRAPKRPVVETDNRTAYSAGLQALGWTPVQLTHTEEYLLFTKGDKRARVYRNRVLMHHGDGNFLPLPMKARRNILLAGQ
jgi:hypothetical protein